MWAINNRTSYKVGSTWGRSKDGVHEWIVSVKATFDITPDGQLALAAGQLDPLIVPEYYGEPGVSSLRYEADLVSMKPTTDLVINGTAYAPGGRPSTEFPVAIRVGSIYKVLTVRGNRTWESGTLGVKPSGTEPVTQVPIVYERAYGGYDHADPDPAAHQMDARNPVGCGVVANSNRRVGLPLPNLEYPVGNPEKAGPAGFGAIDSFWSPRRELAGTYDKYWEQNRRPLLPEDWDPRSLLCSPADQRPGSFFEGGELVELMNLTPNGKLVLRLPKIYLTFSTLIDKRNEEHRGRLGTVIVEPDYPRVIMVWLTSLICPTDVDYLEETLVREKRFIR
jgi:hypothetical protein